MEQIAINIPSTEYLNETIGHQLDIRLYYDIGGCKCISPLYYRLIRQEEQGNIISALSTLADIIILQYKSGWDKIYNALQKEYDLFDTINIREEDRANTINNENYTKNNDNLTKQKTSLITNNNQSTDLSKGAYNNQQLKLTDNSTTNLNNTLSGALDDNMTVGENTENYNKDSNQNEDRVITRKGHTQHYTNQELILQELELRKQDFYDMILKQVCDVLTQKYY